MALKRFTIWLAGRPGYRSRISYADADYFNVSAERLALGRTGSEELQEYVVHA
jgi:hypothetical protein